MNTNRTILVVGAGLLALSAFTGSASAAVIEAMYIGLISEKLPLLAAGLGLWGLAASRKRSEKR